MFLNAKSCQLCKKLVSAVQMRLPVWVPKVSAFVSDMGAPSGIILPKPRSPSKEINIKSISTAILLIFLGLNVFPQKAE